MADLFSNILPEQKTQKRTYYKAAKGRFSSKEISEEFKLRNELRAKIAGLAYWKRNAERLSKEVISEKERANKLQIELNQRNKEIEQIKSIINPLVKTIK